MYRAPLKWVKAHPARLGVLAGWFQQGCTMAVALLLIPIVSAKLPPADAGLWFAFQGLIAMIGLVDLGFGFAISRQASYTLHRLENQAVEGDFLDLPPGRTGIRQLQSLTSKLYLLLAIAGIVLALLGYEIFSRYGNLVAGHGNEVRWVWYLVAFAVITSLSANGQAALLNGIGCVYETRLLAGLYQVCAGAGAALMAFLGGGLIGMGASVGLSALFYRITISWLTHAKTASSTSPIPTPPPGALKKLAGSALPVGMVSIFGSLVYAIQTPLLGSILGPEKVVPFYLAQRIGQACNMAATQLVLPQLPFFTMKLGSVDHPGALRAMMSNLKRTSLVMFLATAGFFLLSPWAAKILLQKSSYVDTTTLAVMAVDFFILGIAGIWGQYVLASGRNPFVWSTVMTGICSLTLSFLLTPKIGIIGLPCATLIAGILFNYRKNLLCGLQLKSSLQKR